MVLNGAFAATFSRLNDPDCPLVPITPPVQAALAFCPKPHYASEAFIMDMNSKQIIGRSARWNVIAILMTLAMTLVTTAAHAADAANVTRATLDNGLRVVIVRNTLAPVVTTVINYLVGSDETSAAFPGTAHATEHMMFRGSKGLSADQLANITAAMGGDFDAD